MNNRRNEQRAWWLGWVGHLPKVNLFLHDKSWASPWAVAKTLNSVLRAAGIVAFANSPLSGLFIIAGMFVGNPNVGWACLLAGLVGVIFSKVLNQPEELISDGVVVFNGILVGCISVAVFPSLSGHEIDAIFWVVLLVILVVNAYIDKGLNALMAPSKLPALSIPFNIAAVLMLLSLRSSAGYTGTNLPMQQHQQDQNSTSFLHSENSTEDINWMKVMQGSFLAAGQIYGVGTMDSSILIFLGFLVFSPFLSVFFFGGSIIGSVLGVLMTSPPYLDVYTGLWGYNAMLTAGGISYFLHITPSSILAACVGALIAALTQAASIHVFSVMTVPVLSYPFNVATLLVLAISTTHNAPLLWVQDKTFPEYHLYQYLRRNNCVSAAENQQEVPLSVSSK